MKQKDLHTKQNEELKKDASSTKQDLKQTKKDHKDNFSNRIDVANEERTRDISKGRP
jgi:hypothetical protein